MDAGTGCSVAGAPRGQQFRLSSGADRCDCGLIGAAVHAVRVRVNLTGARHGYAGWPEGSSQAGQ